MISCSQYDYIEIACLYGIAVELTLINGSSISGLALTTSYNQQKQECMEIEVGGDAVLVPTKQILAMTALCENPHFTQIEFTQE